MPLKADPFSTKLHRRIDVVLFLVTIGIIALVVRVSAHGQSAPSRARGPVDLFSAPLALFQTGALAGGNYLALWQAPFWAVQPDYPNGSESFSVLAGLSGNSEFDTTFLIGEEISAPVAPVTLELGHVRRSFTSSVSTLVSWSNRAGVGSTIPAYGTGFGAGSTLPQSDVAIAVASSVKAGTSQSGAAQIIDSATALNLAAAPLGDTARMNGAGTLRSFTMDPPVAAPDAIAAIRTWDGGGVGDNWDTINNWDNNLLPANTDDVVFGTGFGSGTSIDTIANRTVNSLTFNTATGFSLGNASDTITITSGLLTRNDVAGTEGNHTLSSPITLGANGLWTINGSGTLTVSGAIGDGVNTFSLTKEGSSTLVLSGASTYGGATVINAGTLQLAGGVNRLPTGTAVTLANTAGAVLDLNGQNQTITSLAGGGVAGGNILTGGGTLTVGDANSTTYNGIISETGGALIKQGAGTLTLGGGNSYTGATTISAGVLRAAHTTALGTVAGGVSVASGAALELSAGIAVGAEALSLNGTGISGAGALRNVSGNNSWAGTITFANVTGAYRINSDLGTTLTIGGGITETGSNNNKDLTFGGAGNVVVNGTISGDDMRLFKDGLGLLTLGGANTYEGGTTINGGTVSISANGNLGNTAGGLTFANGATLRVTSSVVSGRTITLGTGGGTLDLLTPLHLTGAISGGTGLTTGGNDLLLNRASGNNAIGLITINSGRVFVFTLNSINASSFAINSGAILDFSVTGGATPANTMTFASGAGVANRVGTLTLNTASASLPTAGTMIFNNDDVATTAITVNGNYPTLTGDLTIQVGGGNATVGTVTLSGVISGGATSDLTKTGIGNLTFSGGAANTYSGVTTVNEGILTLSKTAGVTAIAGDLTIGDGVGTDTVALTAANQIADTSAVTINSSGVLGLGGNSETIGSLTGSAGASVTLSNTTLTVGNAISTSYAGTISGTGGALTKIGAGRLTLSGANGYTGATAVNAGILNIQNATGLGTTAGGTTVSNGATLQLQGGITVGTEALNINGIGASGQTGALVNVSGTNNYGGLLTLAGATTLASDSGILNLTNVGTIAGATFDLTLTGSGTGTLSSIIGTTSGDLTKSGAGTWVLGGASTYSGGTTVNAGTLRLSGSGTLGSTSGALTVNGGTLDVNGTSQTVGALNGTGGTILNNGVGTNLTAGSGGGSGTYSGLIADGTGTLGFIKIGSGTQTLSGANTYDGATAVNAGSLFINGNQSSATGAVSVNGAGTLLGGIGTIGGAVTVNPGAAITGATDLTVGTLTMASLAFNGTSGNLATFIVNLIGAASDTLNITGVLDLSGLFDALSFNGTVDGTSTYLLATYGSITGTFNSAPGFFGYQYIYGPNSLVLSPLTPVPEPSTWVAGILTVLALGWTQRRRLGKFAPRPQK